MTELLKEALLDAKKLREVAEHEAKTSIIEALTPQIRKILVKELTDITSGVPEIEEDTTGMLFSASPESEKKEGSLEGINPPAPSPPAAAPGTGGGLPVAVQGGDAGLGMAMPDDSGRLVVDFDALFVPVTSDEISTGSQGPELPGVVGSAAAVNTGDLTSAPVGDVAMPAPSVAPAPPPAADSAAPATTMTTPPPPLPTEGPAPGIQTPEENKDLEQTPMAALESWHRDLMSIKESVDLLRARDMVPPEIARTALRERMFKSYSALESLSKSGKINPKTLRLQESRLDFLFRVLKEAENGSIYGGADKEQTMVSLAEIQKSLFTEGVSGFDDPVSHKFTPEDSVNSGKTGLSVDEEKTSHAEKVSGVAPGLDLYEENLDRALQEMADMLVKEEASAEATTPGANPALVKAGAPFDKKATHRITDLPENTVLEIDEAELKEAIIALRKENLQKQLKSIRENAMKELETSAPEKDWEDQKEPEGGSDPSHANLKEEMMDLGGGGGGDEGGDMGGSDDMGGGGSESLVGEETAGLDMPLDLALTLNIDNVDTLEIVADEEMLSKLDGGLETSGSGGVPGGDSEADEGDDSLEILDDTETEEAEASDDAGSSPFPPKTSDSASSDEEEDKVKVGMAEGKVTTKAAKAATSSQPAPTKVAAGKTSDVAGLKKQLAEQALFTNKVVYLNKFLQKEGLSKKQHVKIAQLLDKATTVVELKETYKKIKTVLEENANRTATAEVKKQKVVQGSETTKSPGATSPQSVVTESVSQDAKKAPEVLTEGALPPEMAGLTLDFGKWMTALRLPKKGD